MKQHLPAAVLGAAVIVLAWHGPIPQLENYHDFADSRRLLGMPNAADVLSNAAFAAVGAWGFFCLRSSGTRASLGPALPGYALFFAALALTSIGSSFYHLAPSDARLVWDRLPIALACAGLLAATYADSHVRPSPLAVVGMLSIFAIASVGWWASTGDLRPYILLQAAPLVIIPIWQWLAQRPAFERLAFGGAILLYVLAKVAELTDAAIFDSLGFISGHTLKHLLAAAAAAAITWIVAMRVGAAGRPDPLAVRRRPALADDVVQRP